MGEIRLDKSKPYSECRGEMQPDDPHYNVAYWQGERLKTTDKRTGKPTTVVVVLPFDAQGDLVPDDGKTDPWQGLNNEGKPITHRPLWTEQMRELFKKKESRAAQIEVEVEQELENDSDLARDVNLASWLRGETNYPWALLVAAAKDRHSIMFGSKRQMVMDLVLDFKVVPEAEVCRELAKLLPAKETA